MPQTIEINAPQTAIDQARDAKSTLEAIQALRWHLGLGLKEMKTLVERFRSGEITLVPSTRFTKPCPHCGGTGTVPG